MFTVVIAKDKINHLFCYCYFRVTKSLEEQLSSGQPQSLLLKQTPESHASVRPKHHRPGTAAAAAKRTSKKPFS